MRTILEYLRLGLFVGGALIGVQIPSFVEQYGHRLESHLLESKTSLEGFQLDADKYFDGDIENLIQHYAKNADPVINDGGESIASLNSRSQFLQRSWAEFNAGFQQRYWHAFVSPVNTIRAETWAGFDFAVRLDVSAIIWALSLGFILSALIEFFLQLVGIVITSLKSSLVATRPKSSSRSTKNKQRAPTMNTDARDTDARLAKVAENK
ncbi:MAG: DUF2937 family protein [Arenicella sp.]|nr:DUF2937 family protein [Arenicella sp.]